jgi:hypothetical protein
VSWPWPASEQTDKVIPAFVAALQSVNDVAKNKRAQMGNAGSYAYADLDAVLDAAKPELTAKGLAVTQPPTVEGVHAILMHSSGQWLAFPELRVTTQQNTPQAQGSALTYARRYQMLALLNIATEDNDGRRAAKPRSSAAAQPATPKSTSPQGEPGSSSGPEGWTADLPNTDPPTDPQTRKAMALFSEHGLSTKADRLAYTSDVIGRTVGSWADVTKREAGKVIDALESRAVSA